VGDVLAQDQLRLHGFPGEVPLGFDAVVKVEDIHKPDADTIESMSLNPDTVIDTWKRLAVRS